MNLKLGLVLGAALIPAVASAQSADPNDPYAQPTQPAPTTSTPDPNAPTTTTTTVVTPAPQPQPQQPVVVVNPQPARTTIVRQTPESYEVVDAWNAPVFATGALVFAASYGASAVVASTSDHPGAD